MRQTDESIAIRQTGKQRATLVVLLRKCGFTNEQIKELLEELEK